METLPTLRHIAEGNGVELDAQAIERFAAYRDLLLDWNQRVNLTRITDPEEVERRLFGDSITLLPFIDDWRRAHASGFAGVAVKLADVGAGAGFPGLALKIARPEIDLTLVEATGKKVDFMRRVIEELALSAANAIHGRSEELAHDKVYRQQFDIITARAVARLSTLLEYCQPLVRPGGLGLYPKGLDIDAEVAGATNAFTLLGARLLGLETPSGDEPATTIIRVEQRTKIDRRYPRQAGLPAKRPL